MRVVREVYNVNGKSVAVRSKDSDDRTYLFYSVLLFEKESAMIELSEKLTKNKILTCKESTPWD